MINKNYFYGLVLIIIGVMLLLFTLNVLTFDIVLLILSIGLVILYSTNNKIFYLVLGLALFVISSLSLIDDYLFVNISIRPFVYLSSFGIAIIVLYYKNTNRNPIILIPGFILLVLGIHHLIGQLLGLNLYWLGFLFISLAFYLSYLLGYRVNGIVWPKYIAFILLIFSGIIAVLSRIVTGLGIWRLMLFSIPVIIVIFGTKMIYDTIKQKR